MEVARVEAERVVEEMEAEVMAAVEAVAAREGAARVAEEMEAAATVGAARVEVAMEVAATAVAETAGGAKGVGAMGAGTAEAATAVGATATRTWKRCAPRQGSRCDSRRAGRWSHTSRRSGCNQTKTDRPWRVPPLSSGRPAGRFDRQRLRSGSRTARKWRSCSRPQICPPRSGSDRGDPSSSRAGCRFERGSRAKLGRPGS